MSAAAGPRALFGLAVAALAFAATPGMVFAQIPGLIDADVTVVASGTNLEQDLRRLLDAHPEPRWFAYGVPSVPGTHGACCFRSHEDTCCGVCLLEDSHDGVRLDRDDTTSVGSPATVRLEVPATVRVLLRAEGGEIERVEAYSRDCQLDAGGMPLTWLTDVDAAASVRMLVGVIERAEGNRPRRGGARSTRDGALTALAMHRADAAGARLAGWARHGAGHLQQQSIFWLGSVRGREGFAVLEDLIESHRDPKVREHVTFGLYASGLADAVDLLIGVAHDDSAARVRGQALFWLAQAAGERAVATIGAAVEHDPDEEVKVQAVFALSQLPVDRGVPLLIGLARTHANPRVRKQAIFWLGQSEDPRALALIEELIRG